jgi:hypothetical protein
MPEQTIIASVIVPRAVAAAVSATQDAPKA